MDKGSLWVCALLLAACGGGTTSDGGVDAPAVDLGGDAVVDMSSGIDLGTDAPCPDADSDGHRAASCGGDDCDDADPTAYPGATETCDAVGHDEDCDPATFGSLDGDADGVVSNACCNGPAGGARTCGTDCNDTDPTQNPTSPEVCDGVDNDCNGSSDDGLPSFDFHPDCDSDGHGDMTATPLAYCGTPTAPLPCTTTGGGWVMSNDDCDDTRATIYPSAPEHCDGLDDDCDGTTETDADLDGHFAPGSCVPTVGEDGADDCDEGNALVHPGADYQTTSFCPTGTRICSVHIVPSGMEDRCASVVVPCPFMCTGCSPPGFDYDCSGSTDREPARGATAAACSGILSGCTDNDGLYYTGTPVCGSSVMATRCRTAPGPTCAGGPTTDLLGCR